MHYDVEADWQLLNTCNYRCAYCFFSPDVLGERLRVFASPEQWQTAFDATGLTWLLHITGGEPSIYPRFADLCERLAQRHYLSLNSNLTHPSIRDFAERTDPARVNFVHAAFHFVERERRNGKTSFLQHAMLLRDRGFRLMISVVASPEVLAQADRVIDEVRPTGLVPFPKLLRGPYAGRLYPDAYTETEREQFRSFAKLARASTLGWMQSTHERPSIDLMSDDQALYGIPSFTGQLCAAGQRFVGLQPNGDVFRCSTLMKLGNLLQGTLVLRQAPAPCDTSYCFYFCKKYSQEHNRNVQPINQAS